MCVFKKIFFALLIVTLGLVAFVIQIKLFHFLKYHPWTKSDPKYYLTLTGKIDPAMQKDLKFEMQYATTNPSCDRVNYIEGARQSILHTETVTPEINNNQYRLIVPIDKYYQSWCRWAPDQFQIVNHGDQYNFVVFDSSGLKTKKITAQELQFYCKGPRMNESCFINGVEINTAPDFFLVWNKDVNFSKKLNFVKKRS